MLLRIYLLVPLLIEIDCYDVFVNYIPLRVQGLPGWTLGGPEYRMADLSCVLSLEFADYRIINQIVHHKWVYVGNCSCGT